MPNKNKSSLLTFIFSLFPGAGEMYLGFMKQGVSIMSLFFFVLFISSTFEIGPILLLTPIIWFYSFFHVHNLRSLPYDLFYQVEDTFLFSTLDLKQYPGLANYLHYWIAGLLILMGLSILWNTFFSLLHRILPYEAYYAIRNFMNLIPKLIFGIGILSAGIYLIRIKTRPLSSEDDINKERRP